MSKPRSTWGRLAAALRQWRHPSEFRIGEPLWPGEIATRLCEVLPRQTGEPPTTLVDEQVVALGTRVWRLRTELMRQADDGHAATLRHAFRHLDALWEQLTEAGIEVRDHTGEAVPKSGIYLLKTIAHQPVSGISHQRVIETLKPTIYFNKRVIQVGEVIVGTPK